MSYQLFYWVHVVSTIIWLVACMASVYFAVLTGRTDDAVKKRGYMQAERRATSLGAHLGALGILISGGALASIPVGPRWGWFNLQLYPWLFLKQVLFILILVLIGFSVRRSIAFKQHLRNEVDVIDSGTTEKWRGAFRISLTVYILVLVNTLLALTKPF